MFLMLMNAVFIWSKYRKNYNLMKYYYILTFKFMHENFHHSSLQCSVSHDPSEIIRLVRIHATSQWSAAAWQKQCILVRKCVWLWCCNSLRITCAIKVPARAKRDQPPRSGAAVAQHQLWEFWTVWYMLTLARYFKRVVLKVWNHLWAWTTKPVLSVIF